MSNHFPRFVRAVAEANLVIARHGDLEREIRDMVGAWVELYARLQTAGSLRHTIGTGEPHAPDLHQNVEDHIEALTASALAAKPAAADDAMEYANQLRNALLVNWGGIEIDFATAADLDLIHEAFADLSAGVLLRKASTTGLPVERGVAEPAGGPAPRRIPTGRLH